MSGLRFCMITTFYPPYHFGGDAVGIQRLNRGLAKQGHEVTVIHDRDSFSVLSGDSKEREIKEPKGIEVIGLKSRAPMLASLLTQQLGRPLVHARTIKKLLREGDFDVINFHNISLVGGPGVLAYGDAVKLYMAHEHWLVCPSHVLWRHGRERCTGRQCLRCVLSYKRPPQLWRYTGLLDRRARHVDTFIAMSEFSRQKHKEFGFARDMEVLPYFLPDPAPAIERSGSERPHDRPYFLFVGRLEYIKGVDDVIPLFERYPDADFLIAGDGEHRPVLERMVRSRDSGGSGDPGGSHDNVKFLGRVDLEELGRYYEHALALIVPSLCFETFGIILIEAFRQGTPVIARRLGPFPEIVEHACGGELFETDDELLSAMRKLQQDGDYRDRLARDGYRAYCETWCESRVVPRYLDIVRRAAETRGRTRVLERLEG